MNLPKTTELSLKHIVENASQISSQTGGVQPTEMTQDMKCRLKEMTSKFNQYGQAFENGESIKEAADAIKEFMKLAEMYAITEGGDVFQENIIKQNFAEVNRKVQQLQKIAQECYARNQQLRVLFDDIRHVAGRYYRLD